MSFRETTPAPERKAEDRDAWHDTCVICDGPDLHALPRFTRAHLVRCGSCGLTFAGKQPTDAELSDLYEEYGHAWYDSPITRRRYQELLSSFEEHRSTNRLLDMGCGAGYFLEEARTCGWEVYGSEYSTYAIELARAKGIEVTEAPLAPETYPEDAFDVVTAFEVVEHLRAPRQEAATIAHVLRPGGLFYCTTPNFNSISRYVLGSSWSVIDYPEHLCYFTARTLGRWLTPIGFDLERVTSSGISLSRLGARFRSHGSDTALPADADEALRVALEESPMLRVAKTAANGVLGACGAGDTLKALFRLRNPRRV